MIYAYDEPVQLPVRDLYDTQMMAMAINAAKDMYEKEYQLMKDFSKEYGDFMTPITADLDWYNENVTGKVRGIIDSLYQLGIDPLRNPQGRMLIARAIGSMPYGDIAKLKQSAENASLFLKARAELESKGLYNPLLAKYDAPDMSTYSTKESGIWDKMSPTRITDMATFGNPYFEGMKPNIHKESKNGIEYSVEEITMDDLRNIAASRYNELVSTPQGLLMYKYYQDLARQNGSTDVDTDARNMFNEAVAEGLHRRIYKTDNYNDNYFNFKQLENAREQLKIRQLQLLLLKERNDILATKTSGSKSSSGSGGSGDKTPVSYYEPLYQNIIISTLNKDPMRSSMFANNEFTPDMGSSILGAQRNIAQQYFGLDGKDIYGGVITTKKNNSVYSGDRINLFGRIDGVRLNYTVDSSISNTKQFKVNFNKNYMDFLHLFGGDNKSGFSSMFANSYKGGLAKVDELSFQGKTIDRIKGQLYVSFDKSEIDNIYSAKELSARMAGITGTVLEEAKKETLKLREKLRAVNGSIVMKAITPIGGGFGDIGQYGIYAESKIKVVDGNGTISDLDGEFIYKTPFLSTPNPNALKDDNLNLLFDLNTDLERKIMDNSAIRKGFGISSNTGTTDNTLPDSNPWYTLENWNINDDFGFDF